MKIRKLILGTAQMGLDYGINNTLGKIKKEESFKILKNAYDYGIRILDSSEKYGDAHQIIGEFHSRYPECRFNIITKIPPNEDVKNIDLKINKYLMDLNIKYIQYLMFHSFDSFIHNKDLFHQLKNLKKDKVINNIGVSVYTNNDLEILINDYNVDVIQIPFNLFDNFSIRGDLIVKAKNKNILIHTRSVFLQGLFFKSLKKDNIIFESLKYHLIKINEIADSENIGINDLALNYVLQQCSIDNVLIGVDSLEQLHSNVSSLSFNLSNSSISRIDNIIIKDKNLINPSKW